MMRHFWTIAMAAIVTATMTAGPALAGKATLNLIFVVDGLRPDSITVQELSLIHISEPTRPY